ncbi:MAG: DUF5684 domain-containing protein [Oscillospiraceae bacterium]|jgi:hypothetical protein|nr:DUF5684 domain-containing protein [Oscillospiraceae bacterium]
MGYDYAYNFDYGIWNDLWRFSVRASFISFLIGALVTVSFWFLFQKAGEPGWAAVVPFYNVYELFKITWGNGWFFLLLLIPLANFVILIITWVKLAKAFGKGGGWACGLIFLSAVFLPIMAFSENIVYVGAPGKEPPYNAGCGANGYQQQAYQDPYARQGYQQPPYQTPQQQNSSQRSAQNSEYFYQQGTAPSSGAKFCAGCGEALDDGAKFCSKCGRPRQ